MKVKKKRRHDPDQESKIQEKNDNDQEKGRKNAK